MITSPPKRGMALVVVLVLLAVMMLVTITLSGRMQQQLGRTRSQQEYQQALWYSASAESLELSALSLSLKNEKRVHLAQPWASGPRFFPLPQGQIAVTLRDAQACFNLNALAQPTTASRPLAVQQLIALISRLDVPAYFTSSYGPRTLPVSTNCVVHWQPIMLCNRTRYRKRVMRYPAA